MTYLPPFLRDRDPDRQHDMRWARDAYALRGREDRAIRLNEGTLYEEPLTLEVALQLFERLASEKLG